MVDMTSTPELRSVERARQLSLNHVDAEASALYYARVAGWLSRTNFVLELLIAVGTGSSVAAWAIWRTSAGSQVWSVLLGVVAVFNILKPMLVLGDRIKRTENRATRWNEVAIQLHRLALDIRSDGDVSDHTEKSIAAAFTRFDELSQQDSPASANWYFKRVRDQIKAKYPPRFYWPRYVRKPLSDFRPDSSPAPGLEAVAESAALPAPQPPTGLEEEPNPEVEATFADGLELGEIEDADEDAGPRPVGITGGHDDDY